MAISTEEQLIGEIEKWTKKINKERKTVFAESEKSKEFLKNIDAYIEDSKYFLEKKDLVRSFEAVVWAWAFLTIGKDEKIL